MVKIQDIGILKCDVHVHMLPGSVSFLGSMLLFLIPILRRDAKIPGQSENKEHLVVTENKAPLLVSENKDQLLLHENKKPLEKKEIESPC